MKLFKFDAAELNSTFGMKQWFDILKGTCKYKPVVIYHLLFLTYA